MSLERSRAAVERFREACGRDDRVVAAFLGGSLASGRGDAYSDVDLYLVARDPDTLLEAPRDLVAAWGEPAFIDVTRDFGGLGFDMVHFVLDDGVHGELAVSDRGSFRRAHGGPHQVLVDKEGLLEGVEFPLATSAREERRAEVERALGWFGLHAIKLAKVLARDQPWIAESHVSRLRSLLWTLLRAAELPAAEAGAAAGALAASFVALDRDALAAAADRLFDVYDSVGPRAASGAGVEFPGALARVARARLGEVSDAGGRR